jgi:hypothetical protein
MGVLSLLEAAIMPFGGRFTHMLAHKAMAPNVCYLKSKAGAAEISSLSTGMVAEFTTHSASTNCPWYQDAIN